MGAFSRKITLTNPGEPSARLDVEALVDTGAFFTSVPGNRLRGLGLTPTEEEDFTIASGEVVRVGLCEARMELDGRVKTVIVLFGEPKSPALLGAHALEAFALAVDPVRKTLVPIKPLPLL